MAQESKHEHTHHHTHHHSHTGHNRFMGGITKTHDRDFYLWIVVMAMFFLALLVMFAYTANKLMPFIRSISSNHKINISTLCYTVLRILMLLLPVSLLCPGQLYHRDGSKYDKPKLLSTQLSLISLFYFIGSVADILTYNVLGGYVDTGADPIMLKLLWNNTETIGVAFCIIQGIAYLVLSKKMRGHKKTIFWLFFVTFALSAAMPIAYCYVKGTMSGSAWDVWFGKNIYFFISEALMLVGLGLSLTSRKLWSTVIWY